MNTNSTNTVTVSNLLHQVDTFYNNKYLNNEQTYVHCNNKNKPIFFLPKTKQSDSNKILSSYHTHEDSLKQQIKVNSPKNFPLKIEEFDKKRITAGPNSTIENDENKNKQVSLHWQYDLKMIDAAHWKITGLENVDGISCYANASIQSLFSCFSVRYALYKSDHVDQL